MLIKTGVNIDDIHPMLWFWLGKMDELYLAERIGEMVVTSMRREYDPGIGRFTWHSPGWTTPYRGHASEDLIPEPVRAADIRTTALIREGIARDFARVIQSNYGNYLGVVLEPDWLTEEEIEARGGVDRVTPHIHLQLKEPGLELGRIQ